MPEKTPHLEKEKQKLLARTKRIRGQVDGINSLMAEVLEDHIRLHMMNPDKEKFPTQEIAEDLIDLVRAYLK
jgi:DNA-binding FrmR family transcriptional regulator